MSVVTALVAGALGLLAGLALEHFRRSSTDRRWLLDRRHEDAVAFLSAANRFSRQARLSKQDQAARVAAVRAAEEAYFATRITCSERVDELNSAIWSALTTLQDAETAAGRQEIHAVFMGHVNEVLAQLRVELQPGRPWWSTLPRPVRRRNRAIALEEGAA